MRWRDRYGLRRWRGNKIAKFDREATDADIEALIAFAKSKRGVEFFVEPETFATDTTAVAVADDGEWTRAARRRAPGDPQGGPRPRASCVRRPVDRLSTPHARL
ncbi:hypothetical protein GCM10020219_075200 [Nonomuraea dietziae]